MRTSTDLALAPTGGLCQADANPNAGAICKYLASLLLLVTRASLVVTSALLVVTKSY